MTDDKTDTGKHPRALRRAARIVGAAAILTLALAGSAAAASKPGVTTGGAKEISYASAVIDGSVNPQAQNTSYYFQYGLTHAYGGQTPIADAGAGEKAVSVKVAVSGLQPLTVYHYRLVAVNASGATLGSDHTFTTTKIPLSLAILASPNPVIFGGPVTIQGTLSGTENAGRQVILQGDPFASTAGFVNVGNPELTSPTGGFSFTLLGASVTTQYRVVTTTNPVIVSTVATENVAVKVTSHIAKTKRSGYARIYGTVTPAENGAQVGMLRIVGGRGVLAGGTILKANSTTTSSSFSRVVKVKKGLYRVLVRVVGGAQVSNYGSPLVIK